MYKLPLNMSMNLRDYSAEETQESIKEVNYVHVNGWCYDFSWSVVGRGRREWRPLTFLYEMIHYVRFYSHFM